MKPVAKNVGLVLQELSDELLIYNVDDNKAFCLNKTSAFIWRACNGENSVDDISHKLSKEFNAPVNEDLVCLALDQLAKDKLLSEAPKSRFEGMSRREVIRKVGLASMVALPVVASLIAPSAAMAVACSAGVCPCRPGCNNGTPCFKEPACTVAGTCQAGTCV